MIMLTRAVDNQKGRSMAKHAGCMVGELKKLKSDDWSIQVR